MLNQIRMYRTRLSALMQPFFTGARHANAAQNVRSRINIAPISSQSCTFENSKGSPLTGHNTVRHFGEQWAKNKFDPGKIDPRLVATYEEIVDLPNHPEVLLIDVRQPNELAATGIIPASINIPVSNVYHELKLSPKEFESKYGRPKPAANSPIIFSCRIGVRSGEAANIAEQLGFTNVKNYVGSWSDYAEKNNLPQ